MSLGEGVGLACAAGFAGDAFWLGWVAVLLQLENTTANKRQQGAAFFLKIVCRVMGTKGCKQHNGPHQSEESSKLATTGMETVPGLPVRYGIEVRELLLFASRS